MPVLINSVFPFLTKNYSSEARTLIETARQVFAAAETETNFGDLANGMIRQQPEKAQGNLSEIAVWHYERGIKKYREALAQFEKAEAHALPNKYVRYIESKKSECLRRANAVFAKKRQAETTAGH